MNNDILKTFNISIERKDNEVTITGTIPKEFVLEEREATIQRITKDKKTKGFRDGHTPITMIKENVDNLGIWQESAREVYMKYLPEILADTVVFPIEPPQLSFTSIAVENPVSFIVHCQTVLIAQISKYKEVLQTVGSKTPANEATVEEVKQVINDIRRGMFRRSNPEKDIPKTKDELPPITDATVQEISQTSKDVKTFEQEIHTSITNEKKIMAQSAYRKKIFDALLPLIQVSIPKKVIQTEADRTFSDMQMHVKHTHKTMDNYLQQRNITEEELKKEIYQESEKRIKIQLLLNAIAEKENIRPDTVMVEKEIARLLHRDKKTPPTHIRAWVKSTLTSEAVMRRLEEVVSKRE